MVWNLHIFISEFPNKVFWSLKRKKKLEWDSERKFCFLFQNSASCWLCLNIIFRPITYGCPALLSGKVSTHLPCLCHCSCVQNGTDVHVWLVPGNAQSNMLLAAVWICWSWHFSSGNIWIMYIKHWACFSFKKVILIIHCNRNVTFRVYSIHNIEDWLCWRMLLPSLTI